MKDYRPICLEHGIIKIISRALSIRLSMVTESLISSSHSAFIKGHLIFESFVSISEIINMISKSKIPSILLKIDFEKAFDNVSWNFPLALLQNLGFGLKFTSWVSLII